VSLLLHTLVLIPLPPVSSLITLVLKHLFFSGSLAITPRLNLQLASCGLGELLLFVLLVSDS
jgi:hypothetical protein